MRITRPLIGTAVAAAALGATLALGLGMASAATTGHPARVTSHSATSSQATGSAAAQRTTAKHKCPNMAHGATSGTSMPAGM